MLWSATTAEDTEAFGGRLAATRPSVGNLSVVYLSGDLGAGKTTLARGFLRNCGVSGQVRSPTYTLLEVYETSAFTVIHIDLYRLRDAGELEALGLREWARDGYVWLVEWPEQGVGYLPEPDLSVALSARATSHEIEVTAGKPSGERWLRELAQSAPGRRES
jgi:tRNA threonylcarbamoyladenosine biosynthesis protein TsaE